MEGARGAGTGGAQPCPQLEGTTEIPALVREAVSPARIPLVKGASVTHRGLYLRRRWAAGG